MKKNLVLVFFICSLFLLSNIQVQEVSGANPLETFQTNPLEYWNFEGVTGTYYSNNTISIKSTPDSEHWFDSDFHYRKQIDILGVAGADTNYQVLITVTYNAHMQIDFDDLRFVDNDDITELDFWIESYTASTSALVWVEIKDDLDIDVSIFMYYGNVGISTISNGETTFPFFDNFNDGSLDTTNWYEFSGADGVPTETGGIQLYTMSTNSWGSWGTHEQFSYNTSFGVNVKVSAESNYFYIGYDDRAGGPSGSVDQSTIDYNTAKYYMINDEGSVSTQTRTTVYTSYVKLEIQLFSTLTKFYESGIYKTQISHTITDEMGIACLAYGTGKIIYFDYVYVRKCIATEPSIDTIGDELDYDDRELSDISYFEIPVLANKDVSIKTMFEIPIFYGTENISFMFLTDKGIDTNLVYTINNTYEGEKLRLEFSAKNIINVYRISLMSEFQTFISREQISHLISKNIEAIHIKLNNFEVGTEIVFYFISGTVDYSAYSNWLYTQLSISPFDALTTNSSTQYEFTFSYDTSASINQEAHYSYSRNISNFQYIRSYINHIYEYDISVEDNFALVNLTLNIENYTVILFMRHIFGGEGEICESMLRIKEENIKIFEIFSYSDGETFSDSLKNTYKIWRTLDNNLGVGVASDNGLFRIEGDTRTNIETDFTYWFSDRPLNNFEGNITIEYDGYCVTSGGWSLYSQISLAEMEYDFSSDFAIAEPHFSSTWFGLFGGLGSWLDIFVTQFNAYSSSLGIDLSSAFDFWAGIADSIGSVLSPIIESIATTLSPIIEGIASTLSPILESILGGFSDLFGWISDGVLTWANDVADWFINTALIGFVTAIADFFIWFINGIGSLLGITDLAGIIASTIVNFSVAILNFLSGIVLVFSIGASFFSTVIGVITTYGPLLVYYGGWLLLFGTVLVIASMDEKAIMNMFSLYARILEKLLNIFYAVANMVIQFIGGILP